MKQIKIFRWLNYYIFDIMNDPIKLIWKYKNNKRRVQYHVYIFVGNVPDDIMKILNTITDLNLYDSLIKLSKNEYEKLESFYGERWYYLFFNTYHINLVISIVKETPTQKSELIDKYGNDWYEKHIVSYELIERKIVYSYESQVKDLVERKSIKKNRSASMVEEDIDIDFSLSKKLDVSKIIGVKELGRQFKNQHSEISSYGSPSDVQTENKSNINKLNEIQNQTGFDVGYIHRKMNVHSPEKNRNVSLERKFMFNGKTNYNLETIMEESEDLSSSSHDSSNIVSFSTSSSDTKSDYLFKRFGYQYGGQEITDEEEFDVKVEYPTTDDEVEEKEEREKMHDIDMDERQMTAEEEFDMMDIENMYKAVDVDDDLKLNETSKLISQAMNDEKIFEKKISQMVEFDKSKDNNVYDDNLRDVYKKFYVRSQYLYKDDTLATIKKKIACGIKMNDIFDRELYLVPSRQFLWSEYYFNNKVEKVMLGQKWMRRNELLSIDVEPNSNLRTYEELRGSLKMLRDTIRRYNNRIRREDDDNNILFEYENYFTNNEIYMVDVYNELGKNFSTEPEMLRNLQDIYLKIYFPKIWTEDLRAIIDFLNNNKKTELSKVGVIFETINNDLIIENEITNTVDDVKLHDKYEHIFQESYIIQSVVHLNLRFLHNTKMNLFRIFNEFIVDEKYPFIQYQTVDGTIAYKFNEHEVKNYLKKKENQEILSKWFENAPYGISFKIKITDVTSQNVKFINVTLNDVGKVEYKISWKEEDKATMENVKRTYGYVKDLIRKINNENSKINIDTPDDIEFKFAFINIIQRFSLPNKFIINHNDLSNFSRYFYPYVSMVTEPRKRMAKVETEKGKFGTYLRYKRVSGYENEARIEQRIMYIMKNYEFTEKQLASEISKQFSITTKRAIEEYEKVKNKYPNLKKTRNVLKKMEHLPKHHSPGIDINIQGKQPERYKIRISGIRDKKQMDRILTFMNILMYLYVETYHYKKPTREKLIRKLEQLSFIAERRNKVENVIEYEKETKNVKQMAKSDKQRIGFKPEKGQNQWTRSCQNSGDDKKRRPQQYNSKNIEELLKRGYAFNKKTGQYEKKVYVKQDGKKHEVTIKTIKLTEYDNEGNVTGNEIHYACDPQENGEHFYVGFLTRSKNPFGHCMPCCFKKDPMTSQNSNKIEFYKKCLIHENVEIAKKGNEIVGEKLYILQDTNKIQEKRYGFLPKYLDLYFNYWMNRQKKIKQHYLVKTDPGYFFKYGSKQEGNPLLNAIGAIFEITADEIRKKIINMLESDNNEQIFTSLNNGNIKTAFGTRQSYIEFIMTSEFVDFDMINNILSIPNVLSKSGLNIIVFQKNIVVIRKTFEKEKIREDFLITCQDVEDVSGIRNPNKDCIFLVRENKNYYPIVEIIKKDEETKTILVNRWFRYENKTDNIVNHISDFYEKNCIGLFLDSVVYKNSSLTAKAMTHHLTLLDDKEYRVRYQVIDQRNKCKYLILSNGMIVPVRPSGSIFDIQIVKNMDKYIAPYDLTFKRLVELNKKNDNITTKPMGVYYESKKGNKIVVVSIMTITHDIVPVLPIEMSIKNLEAEHLVYDKKPLYEKVDKEIVQGRKNFIVDNRIMSVNEEKYYNESYELFRLEFSEFINSSENIRIRAKLEDIMTDEKMTRKEKIDQIKMIIYRLVDKELFDTYKTMMSQSQSISMVEDIDKIMDEKTNEELKKLNEEKTEQEGGRRDKFVVISGQMPNLVEYQVNNDRIICGSNETKGKCSVNPHCRWTQAGCLMSITKEMAIKFINMLSEELASNDSKAFEILQIGMFYVSDVVDQTRYTERAGQKIIRSTRSNIGKILNDTFGKEYVPKKIGKRREVKVGETNYQQINANNPLKDLKDIYVQSIIPNNLTLYRAYVDGYYWIKNKYSDLENRNLGYYNPLQTELANYFRSLIIDWLNDPNNIKLIKGPMFKYLEAKKTSKDPIRDFIVRMASDLPVFTNCVIELIILSKVNRIPIVVYNEDNDPVMIYVEGLVYDYLEDKEISKEYEKYLNEQKKNVINLRFSFITSNRIPDVIETIYFK